MPPKDRHGKTAQDYRSALIAELDAVPDYRRRRKAQRFPLLFVWLLVPVALPWFNRPWMQRCLHLVTTAEPALEGLEVQASAPSLPHAARVNCQYLNTSISWMPFLNRSKWRKNRYRTAAMTPSSTFKREALQQTAFSIFCTPKRKHCISSRCHNLKPNSILAIEKMKNHHNIFTNIILYSKKPN